MKFDLWKTQLAPHPFVLRVEVEPTSYGVTTKSHVSVLLLMRCLLPSSIILSRSAEKLVTLI